jgi:hypothetical protein
MRSTLVPECDAAAPLCPVRTGVTPPHTSQSFNSFCINNLYTGPPVALWRGMRTLVLFVALLSAPFAADAQEAAAQEGATIESTEVTGLALEQLSLGLRQDIDALVGQPLNRERLNALAARIEGEHPDVVAAVRDVARPDGRVRVVFLVARISDDASLAENINARYVVEHVDIPSIPDAPISQGLMDELRALIGHPLDPVEADRLCRRLEDELPGYDVRRRISRGKEPGRIRVVFEVTRSERSRWLPFAPPRSKVVYHEDQGWSGVLDIGIGGGNNRATIGFVWGNEDDLIEEYSGYRFRAENRKAGTERLGASLEFSRFTQEWHGATLLALESRPDIPLIYDTRITVQPTVTFAFTPRLRLSAGVSVSELEPFRELAPSEHANAVVAAIGYDQRFGRGRDREGRQDVEASYEFRAGTDALDSDLIYDRHVGRARYQAGRGRSTFIADLRLGRITGRAPLFERFSLGDSSTLRGWNKYDIAPAGADRMWHQSIEFRYHAIAYFFDAGSVWDSGTEQRVRFATGFGIHTEHAFLTVGFPLNADDVNATFMLGVRF